ncbi:hypothetical protein [Arvimicrobium flavum]|uniref:hypothetical protein n=1 Tax=Arvimicrobium flavum TaxID=3393320 RepID=UPI00237A4C52|nr:hypothetical protein [Mesorhizobium shangrilense]
MRRLVLLLLMVMACGPASAQFDQQLQAALIGILKGEFETHFSLPVDQPIAYALGFEYLNELDKLCPGHTPDNLAGIRETMYNTYGAYNLLFVRGEKLPPGTSFMTGMGVLLSRIPKALGPVSINRDAIRALNPPAMAEATKRLTDRGCNDPDMGRFISNLAAIATFGRIRHRVTPMSPAFVREELVAGGAGRVCYYDDDTTDSSELSQGYKTITMINFARAISPLEILVLNLQAPPGQPPDQPNFMHFECPATPDPAFPLSKTFVDPKESAPLQPGTSTAQRMADYFVDDLIPKAGEHLTGVRAQADAAFFAALREEIVNFESVDLPLQEIERAVAAFKRSEAARGARVVEPDWVLNKNFESYLRVQKYKAAFGDKLFDMAASPQATKKGIPNYLSMRDVEPLIDMRDPL